MNRIKRFSRLLDITPEYSRSDKIIAWSVLLYSLIYSFLLTFVGVVIYNAISPWPVEWWGHYFFIVTLTIPCIVAAVSTVWFTIGGAVDLFRLFRDLKHRKDNPLDNGMVEGHVSLADKAEFEHLEHKKTENKINREK